MKQLPILTILTLLHTTCLQNINSRQPYRQSRRVTVTRHLNSDSIGTITRKFRFNPSDYPAGTKFEIDASGQLKVKNGNYISSYSSNYEISRNKLKPRILTRSSPPCDYRYGNRCQYSSRKVQRNSSFKQKRQRKPSGYQRAPLKKTRNNRRIVKQHYKRQKLAINQLPTIPRTTTTQANYNTVDPGDFNFNVAAGYVEKPVIVRKRVQSQHVNGQRVSKEKVESVREKWKKEKLYRANLAKRRRKLMEMRMEREMRNKVPETTPRFVTEPEIVTERDILTSTEKLTTPKLTTFESTTLHPKTLQLRTLKASISKSTSSESTTSESTTLKPKIKTGKTTTPETPEFQVSIPQEILHALPGFQIRNDENNIGKKPMKVQNTHQHGPFVFDPTGDLQPNSIQDGDPPASNILNSDTPGFEKPVSDQSDRDLRECV